MTFSNVTGEFTAQIEINTSINQPSIVFFSEHYYYSNGYILTVTDSSGNKLSSDDYKVDKDFTNYLYI